MSLPRLLDVSSYQPTVDWEAEKQGGVIGVYVKLSQGLTYRNPDAAAQVKGARKAGLYVGGYHYCTPGVGSGEQQADLLLAHTPMAGKALRPCLDCEYVGPLSNNRPQLAAWYLAAVTRILSKTGFYPTIYGSYFYLQSFATLHAEVFGRCPLWIADYTTAKSPNIPAPWIHWSAWQWTDANKDPGVSTLVDDSYVAELAALTVPAASVHKTVTKLKASRAAPKPDSLPKT